MSAFETAVFFTFTFVIASMLLNYKSSVFEKYRIRYSNCVGVLLLTIIPGLQFSKFGTDIYNHQVAFYNISQITWKELFEKTDTKIAFFSIAKLLYPLGGRILVFSFFTFIMVLTSYLFIVSNSKKNSIYIGALVFLTGIYFTGAFNILKQGIAVCIVLYGMRFIFKNELKQFILIVLIATLFHPSALISILLYFIWNHKNNAPFSREKNTYIIILSVIVITFYQQIISFITSTFSYYDDYSGYANINTTGRNRDFYLDLFFLLIFLLLQKKMKKYDDKSEYMLCLYIISVVIGFTGFYNPYLKRLALFFSVPSKIYLYSLIPSLFINKNNRYTIKLLMTFYFISLWLYNRGFFGSNCWTYTYDLTNRPY